MIIKDSEQYDVILSNTEHFDVCVIGTGPGGEGAAMKAAKEGQSVVVIEKYVEVGGGCTHWGTIPSKALRHVVHRLQMVEADPLFNEYFDRRSITFPKMLKSAASVIDKQVKLRSGFYTRNDIKLVEGTAVFEDATAVQVLCPSGLVKRFTAKNFIVATGSRPFRPSDIDFHHKRIFDSDKLLSMDFSPKSITIYGAGVIGCEYTSIFRKMGIKVNLINTREKLLSFLDDEIIDALAYHLRDQGVIIRHNETYASVKGEDDGVVVTMNSGKKIKTDAFLFAQGRSGNSQGMNLEEIGVETNKRGHIIINDKYQSSLDHIYAVGDVIGFPALASAAYDQGRFAATHINDPECDDHLVKSIPSGIYTSPEISSVGLTEAELTEQKVPYEIGHASFRNLARAQITGQRIGMLKLLFHRDTLEILGIHCFGHNASEIVHIGQAIMHQKGGGNTLEYFTNTTFNYPTMAEAYRVAALNGLNRLF